MKKLYFDILISGHHSEYINNLVDFLQLEGCGKDIYYFVVHPDFDTTFPDIYRKGKSVKNFNWVLCNTEEYDYVNSEKPILKSFKYLKLVNRYVEDLGIDHVCLLSFNIFQLALIFKRPNYNISGVLFLQFYRMEKNSIKQKFKYYRKFYTTKLYSFNTKIKSIFILNDQETVDVLNKKFKTNIFFKLADPIPMYKEENGFTTHEFYKIPRKKKILLHAGAIDPRKGTLEIIESIKFLKQKEIDKYAILIVGKAKPEFEIQIRNSIEKIQNIPFDIVFVNSFITNERLKAVFNQSYAVLIPYKNPEASSGILGHAALANKIVLAPDAGLIAELVKNYTLGVLIKETNAKCIAEGIEKIDNYSINKNLSKTFISEHSVNNFSKTLLK